MSVPLAGVVYASTEEALWTTARRIAAVFYGHDNFEVSMEVATIDEVNLSNAGDIITARFCAEFLADDNPPEDTPDDPEEERHDLA